MKIDLAVVGQGAVSPAGVGMEALLTQQPVPTRIASLRQPEDLWPVLRVDLKNTAFQRWQKEPRLRRASPMTLYLVEAAEQALVDVSPESRMETGLIVAFCAGCLAYSRRFFEGIITQGQRSASPALFPETVFNSPVSHVAAVLGLNGAAYAVVGDETAWITAIKTGSVWLRQERVKQVLVMGVEEFDPLVLDAYKSAHLLSRKKDNLGFLASEGAAGVLLRQAQAVDRLVIKEAHDGLIYRSKQEAAVAAERLWRDTDPQMSFYPTAERNCFASLENKFTKNRSRIPVTDYAYLGEAFTASSGWHTLRALDKMTDYPSIFLPAWGLQHQFGALELGVGS